MLFQEDRIHYTEYAMAVAHWAEPESVMTYILYMKFLHSLQIFKHIIQSHFYGLKILRIV